MGGNSGGDNNNGVSNGVDADGMSGPVFNTTALNLAIQPVVHALVGCLLQRGCVAPLQGSSAYDSHPRTTLVVLFVPVFPLATLVVVSRNNSAHIVAGAPVLILREGQSHSVLS